MENYIILIITTYGLTNMSKWQSRCPKMSDDQNVPFDNSDEPKSCGTVTVMISKHKSFLKQRQLLEMIVFQHLCNVPSSK